MKSKTILLGFVMSLIGFLLLLQINVALAIASDPNNPITSAITSAINSITNTNTQNDNTANNTEASNTVNSSPTPTPVPASSTAPISGPIINPTPSPSSTSAPLTSPVIHEISPGIVNFGDVITLRSFWSNLQGFFIYVGNVLMLEDTYQYSEGNTVVSFVLGLGSNSILEAGRNYLISLNNQFANQSNSLQVTITAPVVETTPAPTATPSATPSPTPDPVATPVITGISPNPATWGTHIVLTGSNITNSVQIYLNDSLITPQAYTPTSADGTTITFTMPLFTNHRANQTYKLYVKEGELKSNEVDLTIAPSLAYNTATPSAHQVEIEPQVNLDANRSEVLMAYSNFNTNISIPRSVTNPTLNFSNILIPNPYTNESFATFNNAITINANTALGTVKVEIPALTQITGLNWNGILNAPKVLNHSGIALPNDATKTTTVSSVVEIGLGDTLLTFDKAVRILIPGQAGKLVGFQRESIFTRITYNCSADTQTVGDNLADGGDCYISSGNDLVIWTKHFTKFVTYSQTATQSNSNSSSQSASTNRPAQAPVCGDSKPVSAPKLVYAANTGRNEVTLVWNKALNPVSYYLVTYGFKPNQPKYGNPNIGDSDTTRYIVKGLTSGMTYYFKIRAGNGCMPGDFSNEMAVKVLGDNISGPAAGFRSGVLSSITQDVEFKPITEAKPARITASSTNLLTKIWSFLTNLFNS